MAESNIRLGKRKGFTTVYRAVAQDNRLSLKTRGLFLLMQSLPDDWNFTISGLASTSGAGVPQVRAALKQLEDVGYLVREQSHADGGTFAGNVWILQEEPPAPLCQNVTTVTPENAPLCQKALALNASAQNGTLNNNNIQNTPLTPQGEKACVSANANPDDADADSDAANAAPRAVTSNCRRPHSPRSSPKWKPERFAGFWAFYSRHGRRDAYGDAVKAWDKLKPDDDTINLMAAALRNQVNGEMWRRGIGIPYAATWINKRKWETPSDNNDVPAPDEQEVTGWL